MSSPSILILGTDAVLAAAPSTPVQLAHACLAAGYRGVVPVSWGDEIIAERSLVALRNSSGPLVQCCCPHVVKRLAPHAESIAAMTWCAVPPAVATALYVRSVYAPTPVAITFVGVCPGGEHESIDVWMSPPELLQLFDLKGIRLASQPTEFDSVIPPDRRRHYSEPGGFPTRAAVHALEPAADVVELRVEDFAVDLAQQLLTSARALIDVAPTLGCVCSGAVPGVPSDVARVRVRELEPPRAPSPVVDHAIPLAVHASLAPTESGPADPPSPPPRPEPPPLPPPAPPRELAIYKEKPRPAPVLADVPAAIVPTTPPVRGGMPAPRRSSTPSRSISGVTPHSRAENGGRPLPRAYVARRRSSPKGFRHSGVFARKHRTRWIWISALGLGAFAFVVGWFLAALAR